MHSALEFHSRRLTCPQRQQLEEKLSAVASGENLMMLKARVLRLLIELFCPQDLAEPTGTVYLLNEFWLSESDPTVKVGAGKRLLSDLEVTYMYYKYSGQRSIDLIACMATYVGSGGPMSTKEQLDTLRFCWRITSDQDDEITPQAKDLTVGLMRILSSELSDSQFEGKRLQSAEAMLELLVNLIKRGVVEDSYCICELVEILLEGPLSTLRRFAPRLVESASKIPGMQRMIIGLNELCKTRPTRAHLDTLTPLICKISHREGMKAVIEACKSAAQVEELQIVVVQNLKVALESRERLIREFLPSVVELIAFCWMKQVVDGRELCVEVLRDVFLEHDLLLNDSKVIATLRKMPDRFAVDLFSELPGDEKKLWQPIDVLCKLIAVPREEWIPAFEGIRVLPSIFRLFDLYRQKITCELPRNYTLYPWEPTGCKLLGYLPESVRRFHDNIKRVYKYDPSLYRNLEATLCDEHRIKLNLWIVDPQNDNLYPDPD